MWHTGRRQKLKNYMGTPITANRVAWSLTAILGLGLSAGVAFYFGYDYGLQSVGASAGEVKQLRLSAQQQQKELLQLNNDLVALKQDRDIAIQTAKKLQEDNKKSPLSEKITKKREVIKHTRSHIGLDLGKVYKEFTKKGYTTKDFAFLSIAPTYEVIAINPETGLEETIIKNSFDNLGNPILNTDGIPEGKLVYKAQELQPLAFLYINKLNEKIESQEKRLDDLEKQIKILLKK